MQTNIKNNGLGLVFRVLLAFMLTAPCLAQSRSDSADAVFADVRPALLQIRTLVGAGEQQSSIGSGFLVSSDGLVITNYHVVSQYALEPSTYRLQFTAPDGARGELELLAIDVVSDLALVRMDREVDVWLEFDPRGLIDETPQGERLFAIGNPMDLGFTIVEGTHNGLVEKSYVERIHFSGALNPGMSGGPTLTASRQVAGVNVSRMASGQLMSFLVPSRHALALIDASEDRSPMSLQDVRAEITRQLQRWQGTLYAAVDAAELKEVVHGRYRVREPDLPWMSCWAGTNTHDTPRPRAKVDNSRCSMQNALFIAGNLQTGQLQIAHSHVRSDSLNQWQFARFLSRIYAPGDGTRFGGGRRMTATRCHDAFVQEPGLDAPGLRAVWCARAYREFEGLFDVEVSAVTQDDAREALISKISMSGVSYETALVQARRFLESITWAH